MSTAIDQVGVTSYLGRELNPSHQAQDPYGDPEGPPSPPSSDESDYSESDKANNNLRRKKNKNSTKKSKLYSRLKPVQPGKYNGQAGTHVFHKFIMECNAYIIDGRVPRKRQVSALMHFLEDKAHEFFIREVAYDPENWTLERFFKGLFDYCFPIDFLGKQRHKFSKCKQGDRTTREFIAKINELSLMVGDLDDRDQTLCLWWGADKTIQYEMWKMQLNPESSSFSEVSNAAQAIDMAMRVANKRNTDQTEHKPKRKHQNTPEKKTEKTSASTNVSLTTGSNSKPSRQTEIKKPEGKKQYNNLKRAPLTDEQRKKFQTEGRCFRCRETGHIAKECPESNNKILGSSSGPPGVKSHALLVDTEQIEALAQSTERVDEIEIYMMSVPSKSTQISKNAYPKQILQQYKAVERHAAVTKDISQPIPNPPVIMVSVNGHPVQALLDSGLLSDFMSSTLADQLNVPHIKLAKPLPVNMAVQGSRTKKNSGTKV
ncbi:MAG: retropepsin-like aspartic protease [Rhizonema sp. PD38]|nr:retropepsin-like aspartic protease [Rhizonema sp. PD38]